MNPSSDDSLISHGSIVSSDRSSELGSGKKPSGSGHTGPYWDELRKLPRVRVGVAPNSGLVFWGDIKKTSTPQQGQNPQSSFNS